MLEIQEACLNVHMFGPFLSVNDIKKKAVSVLKSMSSSDSA